MTKPNLSVTLPRAGALVATLRAAVQLAPTRWKYSTRSILLRKRLTAREDFVLPPGHRWDWAGPEELRAMDQHPEATSRNAYERRANRGDACLCLKKGDELLGYRWIARHCSCLYCGFGPGYELRFLPLAPNQAFLYDLYVYKKHRRHGCAAVICQSTYEALRQEGIDEAFSLMDPDNHPVIGLNLRLEVEPVCMAYGFRIRQWSTMLLGPETDGPRLRAWLQQWQRQPSPRADAAASPGGGVG